MKIERTSKWFAFALVALMFVALMPMAVKPAAAANPDETDWIPDQMVSDDYARDDGRPSIATGPSGRLYVAYEHRNPETNKWEIKVALSTDGGTNWAVIYTQSSAYNLYRPSIAVDPISNDVYVVFERHYGGSDWDIHCIRRIGGSWSYIVIDNDGGNDRLPCVTVEYDHGASNYVHVAYEEQVSSLNMDIWYARSTDHGATWNRQELRDTANLCHNPSIAYADEWVYIAYRSGTTGTTGGSIDIHRSPNRGTTWYLTTDIDSTTGDCSQPSVTATHGPSPAMDLVMVSYTYEWSAIDDDIFVVYSVDNAVNWVGEYGIAGTALNERWSHLAVDGMGETSNYVGYIHCTWTRMETVGARTNGIYHRKANFAAPNIWGPTVQIADDNAKVDEGYWTKQVDRTITTVQFQSWGPWVPVVVWTDYRGGDRDVYASTLGGKYTIDTSPSGLQVRVDGLYYDAPVSFWWALGSAHSLYAPNQPPHTFVSWSDGGSQSHTMYASTFAEELIVAYYTPTLTLSLSPTTVARGSPLTISGQLTPGRATTISLYYRMSGVTWAVATTLPTNPAGAYGVTVTVPMSLPTGTYDLVAVWYDSNTNHYAVSTIKQLTITP